MQWIEDIIKIAVEDGVPVAILMENGHDEFYTLRKASKEEKSQLLGVVVADRLKN